MQPGTKSPADQFLSTARGLGTTALRCTKAHTTNICDIVMGREVAWGRPGGVWLFFFFLVSQQHTFSRLRLGPEHMPHIEHGSPYQHCQHFGDHRPRTPLWNRHTDALQDKLRKQVAVFLFLSFFFRLWLLCHHSGPQSLTLLSLSAERQCFATARCHPSCQAVTDNAGAGANLPFFFFSSAGCSWTPFRH